MNRKIIIGVLIGFAIGVLGFLGFRIITYKSHNVHYHANFALYVNGQRDEFKSFTFYEEVQACSSDDGDNPKHRTHMHNEQNDLVHVHAPAVTWGHLFANLGYSLGDKSISTDEGTFTDGDKNKLIFLLNGKQVDNIANRVIGSEDRLLIDYGEDNEQQLQQKFDTVASSASEYNGKFDPGGCSGNENLTLMKRLENAISSN